jgi:hypothetical protein
MTPSCRVAAALLLTVFPLLALGPALPPGRVLLPQHPTSVAPLALEGGPARLERATRDANLWTSDALFPFLTDARAQARAMRAGDWPTWAPELGLGIPRSGGTLVPLAYPPNLLHLALDDGRALAWIALFTLYAVGLGMHGLLGARGLSAGARLVGAVGAQAAGWGLINLHYGMKVGAACWLPWMLFAVERLAARRRGARLQLSVATALAFLAGFPPIAVFALVATLAYGLARAPRALGALHAAAACGVLAAAVVLVPMLEVSRASTRGAQAADVVAAAALPRAALGTAFVPALFGDPRDPFHAPRNPLAWWLVDADERDAALSANGLEWNLHVGVALLLLALAALVCDPRRALLPGSMALLALAFAFGWPAPVRWLYRVPGLDLGAPGRALAVLWIAVPWLAALGFEALRGARRLPALAVVLATGLVALALGAGLATAVDPRAFPARMQAALQERHGVDLATVREYVPPELAERAAERLAAEGGRLALAAGLALVAALLTAALARRGGARATVTCAAAWLALVGHEGHDLARAHLAPRAVPGPLFPPSPALDAVHATAGSGRVLRLDTSASGVADIERLARPDLLSAYGVRDLTPYCVFTPRHLVELVLAVDPAAGARGGISRVSDPRYIGSRLYDMLRVTCVLSTEPVRHVLLEETYAAPGFHVYRRARARGTDAEARVYPAALPAHGATPFPEALAAGVLDPDSVLVVHGAPEVVTPVPAGWRAGDVRVARPSTDRVEIRVAGSDGGWLCLADGYGPGWRATVDGAPAPVRRAQHVLRAVPIPAGDCRVVLSHAPGSLRLGLALTLLAVLLMAHRAWRERAPR